MATNAEIHKFQKLSKRRREILHYICKGLKYSQISELLFVTEGNVRKTLHDVYKHLELLEFRTSERVNILAKTYCPLFKLELPLVATEEPVESETVKALTVLEPNANKMLDEDQKALVKVFGTELEKSDEKPRGSGRSFVARAVRFIFVVAAIAAISIFAWERLSESTILSLGQAEANQNAALLTSQASELFALQTDVAIAELTQEVVASNTPNPPPSESPTNLPTSTKVPSSTSTQRPSPTADFGPIYEVGEWHVESDVWYRLFDYEIDGEIVRFLFEVWNKSNQDILFQWSTKQNMSLTDNLGNDYELGAIYRFGDYDEIIVAQEKILIQHGSSYSVGFYSEQLYLPSVTEAFFTLEYFSRIERATWIIYIAK